MIPCLVKCIMVGLSRTIKLPPNVNKPDFLPLRCKRRPLNVVVGIGPAQQVEADADAAAAQEEEPQQDVDQRGGPEGEQVQRPVAVGPRAAAGGGGAVVVGLVDGVDPHVPWREKGWVAQLPLQNQARFRARSPERRWKKNNKNSPAINQQKRKKEVREFQAVQSRLSGVAGSSLAWRAQGRQASSARARPKTPSTIR